ncbi:hypothetical protein OHB26_00270 [Nocardia sp. NBC_01503]|uniref:hypothetical protein n=1 Tax=Nocardia sp. NBC_01503 TaxID=2975997 RepID=UPI002E7B99F2|nr:hypothetical protein [Nocardia sp. NBC_01503]WTL32750.1 hypothetical protein OHB26_00270 [Nocardia sp. NBC_01503]
MTEMPKSDPGAISTASTAARYAVYVPIPPLPDEDRDDLALQLVVNGPMVPRTGDLLNFDGPRGRNLALIVTQVEHSFSSEPGRTPMVHVTAELDNSPIAQRIARDLLDLIAFKRWVDAFPTVEFPAHLRSVYEHDLRARNESE